MLDNLKDVEISIWNEYVLSRLSESNFGFLSKGMYHGLFVLTLAFTITSSLCTSRICVREALGDQNAVTELRQIFEP